MSDDLTARQTAAELGVTVRTVQRWIADGRLPARRVGGRVRVSRSSLTAVASDARAPSPRRPIRTLLVANRGEIAVRIARTARRLGIRVVGVHAPDERPPAGVDHALPIGSYLDGAGLIDAARLAGADAVHPGYGFLAENPAFARAVMNAGLTWVGPPPGAIEAMGDKAAARRSVAAHGVPTVPGYDGAEQDDHTLAAEAGRIGFPLLVKPSAGGGGKGMRVVRDAAGLHDALGAARREAARAFGDDRLILERYLAGARHVEVQVLFDAQGTGVHLGERDCSTQRRNQKIVEEAPGPSVDEQLRERMGEAAIRAAAGVGYVNAGTIEMLLADDGAFFFLEMNTRLQVEHPVTEAVTGRDLVEDQIRIAAGSTLAELGLGRPPRLQGHAIEARIYAEDPEGGFLPATGRISALRWPDGVRVDTGVEDADEVSDRYDPMLAKVIAHGRTREEALGRLREALDATLVLGVRTNVRFLRWLLRQPVMRDGQVRTDTLASLTVPPLPDLDDEAWTTAAGELAAPGPGPWDGGWRLNGPPTIRLRHDDTERIVALASEPAHAVAAAAGTAHVDVDGQSVAISIAPPPTIEAAVRHATAGGADGAATLVAPMPGRVVSVRAAVGASVSAHQPVVVIEAMKMEHAVVAPFDGTVEAVAVAEGQQVQRGDVLGEVAPHAPQSDA